MEAAATGATQAPDPRLSVSVPPSPARPAVPLEADASRADFARMLRQRMAEPRSAVRDIRAQIDAIRSGQALISTPRPTPSAANPYAAALSYAQSAGGPDSFGWRALARSTGDRLVAPGFGAIFERQIGQESGYDPEVVFGLRVSSAGAEGIAQLMPQYYPSVNRANPQESLVAGAQTMRHYLAVLDGDVRQALSAYNAGLGRVQSLIRAYGDDWEQGLPAETKRYLAEILGDTAPIVHVGPAASGSEAAVFGGAGPGGVLVAPVDAVLEQRSVGALVEFVATAGSVVRAPAEGVVSQVLSGPLGQTLVLDHGNGWRTTIEGVLGPLVEAGASVSRAQPLGVVGVADTFGRGLVRFGVTLDGRSLDPRRYLLRS